MPADPVVVLGVAGGSGSGKTTVAQSILDRVGRDRVSFVPFDSYYKEVAWRRPNDIGQHNFDHPDALDTELFVEHLQALRAGHDVEIPIYDFVHHRRTAMSQPCASRRVVVTEGILLLFDSRVRQLLDFKIFVDTDADVRLMRRIRRDLEERGRELGDVLRQYSDSVRPMHLEFVEPSKRWADIIVPEGGENEAAMQIVTGRVEQLLAV